MGGTPVIELNNVSKTFKLNGVTACRDISLSLLPGKTIVLMGENGAGKSTLASLMGGVIVPDSGSVRFGEGLPAGIVHQKPSYVEGMTVGDMIFGGNRLLSRRILYSARAEKRRIEEIFILMKSSLSPDMLMGDLVPYQQQETELAENLLEERKAVILDEPEFPRLKEMISFLKEREITPVIITHKVKDAIELGDRIVVMRKGQIILDRENAGEDLSADILKALSPEKENAPVEIEGEKEKREGIIRVIAGYHESGLWDEEARIADRLAGGLNGYIPSLNRRKAMEDSWSPIDNLMIHERHRYKTLFGFIRKNRYVRDGFAGLEKHGIIARPQDSMKHLSGGNQKKLLLVREFQRPGPLLLLAEPSTALDLANRDFLYDLIRKAKREGKEVLVLTADPEEALLLGDEITPLFGGVKGPALKRSECTLQDLTARMGGAES